MTQLYEIKVSLSPNQKNNLSKAYHKRETIVLRLTKDSLSGNDTLYVPQNIVKRLDKNRKLKKGMEVKLSKTNIRKQVGGSLLSTVLALGKTLDPAIVKALKLSAYVDPASQTIRKMTGFGAPQMGLPRQRPRRSTPKPTNNQNGGLVIPYRTPPFYGNWPNDIIGMGTIKPKKTKTKSNKKKGMGLF